MAGGEGLRLAAATGAQYRRVDDESKIHPEFHPKFHPTGFEFYRNLHKFHNLNNNNNHSSKNNNNNDSPPSDKAAVAAAAAMILQQHHRIGGLLAGRRPSCDITATAGAGDQQPLDLSSLSVPKYNVNGGRSHPYFSHQHHHQRTASGHQQSSGKTSSPPPPTRPLAVHAAIGSSSDDEDDDDDDEGEEDSVDRKSLHGDSSPPLQPLASNENGKPTISTRLFQCTYLGTY